MEGSQRNGSNLGVHTDIADRAKEIFLRINTMVFRRNNDTEIDPTSVIYVSQAGNEGEGVPQAGNEGEGVSQSGNEGDGVPQDHHLISSVRFTSEFQRDFWRLESVWDNVDISRLDETGMNQNLAATRTAMAENVNVVLLRHIFDYNRGALSLQIVWSGGFADCDRLLQLLNTHTPGSIQFIRQSFNITAQLRPTAEEILEDMPTVIVDHAIYGDGEELLCAVCTDPISIGNPAKQLPCNHLFHENCISTWFRRKLTCPLCRRNFR